MDFIKLFFRKKSVKILIAMLAVGILLIITPFIISAKQCPSTYTQQQVDTSSCIVGADIGSGMIWLLGICVTAVALIGLCVSSIRAIPSKLKRVAVGLILFGGFLLVVGFITAPLLNSSEIYKTAKCSANNRTSFEEMNKEYCEFPRRSPQAVIDYSNNKVIAGAALLMGGIAVSGYSLLKHRLV